MSRTDISMTSREVDDFLARCPQMVIGWLDGHGWPTATLAQLAEIDLAAGRVIARAPVDVPQPGGAGTNSSDIEVCCVADEHRSYFDIRGVTLRGRIDPSTAATGRYRIDLERVVSFDFGRLR